MALVTCGTPGSQWWCGGQEGNYHIHPPFNYPSLFGQLDCKNQTNELIIIVLLKLCSPSKTLSEEVLYPNILQNPSNPWLSVPPLPHVGDCVGKLFWPPVRPGASLPQQNKLSFPVTFNPPRIQTCSSKSLDSEEVPILYRFSID